MADNEVLDFTGLMNREAGEAKIAAVMNEKDGALVIFDVDNIGKLNDAFGLKAGDKAIEFLADILKNEEGIVSCHLGGDKFMSFLPDYSDEQAYEKVNSIIAHFYMLKENDVTTRSATLSAGVALVTKGVSLAEADNRADKALYFIKQSGKAGVSFYQDTEFELEDSAEDSKLVDIIKGTDGNSSHVGAMDIDYKYFAKLYDFVKNLSMRFNLKYSLLMVKLENITGAPISADESEKAMVCLEQAISTTVRGVDINSRYADNQFLTILMESDRAQIKTIMERVFNCFTGIYGSENFKPSYEMVDIEAIKAE